MNRSSFLSALAVLLFSSLLPINASAALPEGSCERTLDVTGLVPCGCHGELICLAGDACDPGHRPFLISPVWTCQYSGYSEEPDNSSVKVERQEDSTTLWGWSDVHEHQFSNLAYGGSTFWGAPFSKRGINAALAWCDYAYGLDLRLPSAFSEFLSMIQLPSTGNSLLDVVLNFYKEALTWLTSGAPVLGDIYGRGQPIHGDYLFSQWIFGLTNNIATHKDQHLVQGTGSFRGWPNYDQGGHQQMYYKWLERAYQGGMRLLVNLAVNNEALCWLSTRRSYIPCRDMNAANDTGVSTVDLQIQAMKDLQDYIDTKSGGPGKGWYQIVTTPNDARSAIREGKMAVIIGIEVDTLFGCEPDSDFCTPEYVRNRIEEYRQKDVRYFFPVHFFDNEFAGGALYSDHFVLADILTDFRDITRWNCVSEGYTFKLTGSPDQWADCNARGLTDGGIDLIKALMDADMIIDVDHLSHRAMHGYHEQDNIWHSGALELFEGEERGWAYPPVSGHPMILQTPTAEFQQSVETVEKMRDMGGIVAVNMARGKCNTTYDIVHGYDDGDTGGWDRHVYGYTEIVELMSWNGLGRPPFYGEGLPGISLSTDMGAFNPQPGPRYLPDPGNVPPYKIDPECDLEEGEEIYQDKENHLRYPFAPYDPNTDAGDNFEKQVTGDRTFDYNIDGLAHIGLMPDLVADMENVGVTRDELDPLFNSAETFVRMWERVENCTPDPLPPVPDAAALPEVHGVCSATITEVPTASDLCHYVPIEGKTSIMEFHDQGIHTVAWAYTDDQDNSSTQNQLVSVIDNVPPTIDELSADPDTLWPPTNKMVPIEVTAVASDNCDMTPACLITAVSSNEAIESSASKNKTPDWLITGERSLEVRSEKTKSDIDRVYDIEVTCTDYAGNSTVDHTEVRVPHDAGKK